MLFLLTAFAKAEYIDVFPGQVLPNNATADIRLVGGPGGTVVTNSGVTSVNSITNDSARAVHISIGAADTLRIGSGGILMPSTDFLTLIANGFLTAGSTDNAAGTLSILSGRSVVISSAIVDNGAGAVGLTKTGTGTLYLSTAGGYTGGTIVEEGRLLLLGDTGSPVGTGGVTVQSSGTLAGFGTVLGDTTVAGTLSPDNGGGLGHTLGDLHFDGALNLGNDAVVRMEIRSDLTFDHISVEGLIAYNGNLEISFVDGYAPTLGQEFLIFDVAAVAPGSSFLDISITGLASGFGAVYDGTTGKVSVVPEPTVASLLLLGAGLAAMRRCR